MQVLLEVGGRKLAFRSRKPASYGKQSQLLHELIPLDRAWNTNEQLLDNLVGLDQVLYESEVETARGKEATILFTDRLSHKGLPHTFRCRQRVTVGTDGRIEHIAHREIDGERERLNAFFEAARITWPPR